MLTRKDRNDMGENMMIETCPTAPPKPVPPRKRTCNRHDDCDAADAKARTAGRFGADHCHDDCCEDCFGQ